MSLSEQLATAFEAQEEHKLRLGLVRHAFKTLKLGMLATIGGAGVLTYAVWDRLDQAVVLGWLFSVMAISIWRFILAERYERQPERYSLEQWEQLFIAGASIGGVIYGSVSFLLYVPDDYKIQSVLIIVLAGMAAGAMNTLSSMLDALRFYLITLLMPLIVRLALEQEPDSYLIASLIFMFMIMLLVVAQNYYKDLLNTLHAGLLYDKATRQLDLSEERFETIFREAPVGIFYYDTNLRIVESNAALAKILHVSLDLLDGLDLKTIPDRRILPCLNAVLERQEGFYEGEYVSKLASVHLYISMRTEPIFDGERALIGGIAIVSDITEYMMAQEKIRHQAYYDTLTDIPNRTLMMDYLRQSIMRYQRHQNIAALLFLDLDQFKKINDSLGHTVGDALLREMAGRLKSAVREEDIVSRLGGDEFVILLPDLDTQPKSAAAKAEAIAEKIHEALSQPFTIQGHRLNTSTSIGVAMTDAENDDPDNLLKHADMAMYQSKKEGRGKTTFYEETMDRWIKARLQLEFDLKHAIESNLLELYYQPVISFKSGHIVGAEALLRWKHPDRGFIDPEEVIALAEETGLIEPLGAWVLEHACLQLQEWTRTLPEMADFEQLAINVSTLQFNQPDYVQQVFATLAETKVEPSRIILELTESVIVEHVEETAKSLQALRTAGIGVALDDFGTGYASLYYLKKLPFTALKIDRSFTLDLQEDADDAMLIETIASIARKFNFQIVAEGVETPEQYRFLKQLDCDTFQGYLCSPPLPADAFAAHYLRCRQGCPDAADHS